MRGAVIGAGVAGISMAHALRRVGISVDLFEQTPEARSTGYQLNVLPNGKYALGQIGLLGELNESGQGAPIHSFVFLDGLTDRVIQRIVFPSAGRYSGMSYYRADLHLTLLRALTGDGPQYGRTVTSVVDDLGREQVRITFSDGESREFDFVVAADGIRSKVRSDLFPEHRGFAANFDALLFAVQVDPSGRSAAERRFADQVGGGEFVQISAPGTGVVLSAAGRGRFGVIITMARLSPERHVASRDDARSLAQQITRRIRDPRVRFAIDAAVWDPGNPLIWHIGDIDPLPAFHSGRIALSGDAAHAMLPVIGQGANQAFEDAMILSRLLNGVTSSGVQAAFERYSTERAPHVGRLQNIGRRNARMGRVDSRFAHVVAGIGMRLFLKKNFDALGRQMLKYANADPNYRAEVGL
jgi:2-polyprenyl-6-methoxyphenol hydroxylase-like FAD-dependent oxidoreductase